LSTHIFDALLFEFLNEYVIHHLSTIVRRDNKFYHQPPLDWSPVLEYDVTLEIVSLNGEGKGHLRSRANKCIKSWRVTLHICTRIGIRFGIGYVYSKLLQQLKYLETSNISISVVAMISSTRTLFRGVRQHSKK